jgi:RNA polymerase subunit RPABC4/transcription elongation factor Spt4
MAETKQCSYCAQLYLESEKECPHCADAKRYINATGLVGIGLEKLRKELPQLMTELGEDAGHPIPPLFSVVIYRLYHTGVEPSTNTWTGPGPKTPPGFRDCPVCEMAIPEDETGCGHCEEAFEYLRKWGIDIDEAKPTLEQIEQDIYGQILCKIPPKYVLMIYRRYHMAKGDAWK